jgi:epoxyqueuosine reductase
MDWMEAAPERRGSPAGLWPEVRSIVMLGLSYAPEHDPMEMLAERGRAALATYATRRDYHDVIKGRLKELAGYLAAKAGADVKVFVDTAPVMEKALAAASGLGWVGKHSVVVSREHGSWLLLGAIFTTAELPPDEPEVPRCGSCTRCLDVCPTGAFPRPHVLDSGRCIAYLTIEHQGHIASEFREAIGNRVFGCDDCLAVCPWNKFAETARDQKLAMRGDLSGLPLRELSRLDDAAFRQLFAGTPIKRTGRDRFLRNVLIAIGNSDDPSLVPEAVRLLDDPSPLVRAMAVWAAGRLLATGELARLAEAREPRETDQDVRAEWRLALSIVVSAEGGSPLPGAEGRGGERALSGEVTPLTPALSLWERERVAAAEPIA